MFYKTVEIPINQSLEDVSDSSMHSAHRMLFERSLKAFIPLISIIKTKPDKSAKF